VIEMRNELFVGTSGFAYKEWKPEFYPADLKNAEMLSFYSRHFNSVEINATFYRAPTEKQLRTWAEQTPDDFRFTLKAPQKITHIARLRDTGDTLEFFLRAARTMGERLGCILFQCPPSLKYDAGLLESFVAALPGDPFRFAMEFRHESWGEAKGLLVGNNIAWCVADTDEAKAPMVRTSQQFIYLRLRGLNYTDDDLQAWAKETTTVLDNGGDAYVYFKHEDDPSGVRYGLRFRELIEATRSPSSSEQPSSEEPSSS
jgi:uncharacterized protein YecE (DUF72 family)